MGSRQRRFYFIFLTVWNFIKFQPQKVLGNILSQILCFCQNIFQIFEGRIFQGKFFHVYTRHILVVGQFFCQLFTFSTVSKQFFLCIQNIVWGWLRMMLINSSNCCGKKCNLSLASMPSSLLKFCTCILASWPLERHCMKELVVEGLRLCIRRGPKLALENPMT